MLSSRGILITRDRSQQWTLTFLESNRAEVGQKIYSRPTYLAELVLDAVRWIVRGTRP